ncbi:MAG: hypothetical protein GXP62_02910 [Oligoflexia bacterium]|nr:hypothetical protein [Oligoflexia bacterium]
MSTLLTLALVGSISALAAPPVESSRELPRSSLDYSALTLDQGQLRVGLDDIDFGLLQSVQLGSNPLLDAVGIYNLRGRVGGRVNAHMAAAVDASGHSLRLGQFEANQIRVGGRASVWAGPLGLHGAVNATSLTMKGSPDVTQAAPLVAALIGKERLAAAQGMIEQAAVDVGVRAMTISMRAAVELHLARAHALVLQAGDTINRQIGLEGQAKAVAEAIPGDNPLSGLVDAESSHTGWASAAWQVVGKHLNLRVGVGFSNVPLAWLVPSMELSWKIGRPASKHQAADQEDEQKVRAQPGNS